MEYIIYIIAGLLAGIATGLVGLSAAVIIAPIFATFLGMNPYIAIGIALASDVFASAITSVNYARKKYIDLYGAMILASTVLLFAVLASYLSYFTHPNTLNTSINVFVFILGIRFIIFPVKSGKANPLLQSGKSVIIQTLAWGAVIGFISGFFGSGGGLSMLAVLTMLLGYNIKKGIGTSTLVMTFTALVGALTHFIIGGTILIPLLLTSFAAFIGAYLASKIATKISDVSLNRLIGGFLLSLGIALIIFYFI